MQEEELGFEKTMAQVVYYLCRNGKVEPPHMIDVVHHSPGLRLRDVKQRLTALRGSRMPAMYSWSFKRNYKNASIWQDVFDDDFVLPVSSGEYVLKGSEIVENLHGQGQVIKSQSLKQPSEILQRKFWGAESWLTSAEAPRPRVPELNSSAQQIVQRRSWEQAQTGKSGGSRRLGLSDSSSSSDERESKLRAGNNDPSLVAVRHSTGNLLQDASIQNFPSDVKLYTIKAPMTAEHATQTSEYRRRTTGEAAPIAEDKATVAVEDNKPKQQDSDELPVAIGVKKQSRLRKVFSQEKEITDLGRHKSSKNSSSPWMFLHVLSYCGGLDTKAQTGNVNGNVNPGSDCSHDEHSGESRTDGEAFSFSDASRETHQSRTSTGDSFNSSDASDEGRAHKISAFVDVKEMLVSPKQQQQQQQKQSVGLPPPGGKSFSASLLGRQYGRLSKSGTYYPRNVKYDTTRRQHASSKGTPLKVELNCYNAE